MTLNDQRIVVLGGTSGIGLAVAQAAAAEGARIVVASRDIARIEQALATLPAEAEGRSLDLQDGAAVEAFFAEIGPFDHLVYTAGESLKLSRLEETEIAEARRFFDLRYWGAYTAAKCAHGRIRPGPVAPWC
jgi:NAD(P)-dependent dehydrogenase (short-subunit alcohol dehydrogenase family)